MPSSLVLSLVLVTTMGAAYHIPLVWFWGYFPDWNPITLTLFDCCTDNRFFLPAIHFHDFIVNILLYLPLAYFILQLRPAKSWLYLVSALAPVVMWDYQNFLFPPYWPTNWVIYMPGLFKELTCLPIAFFLLMGWSKYVHT
jgi:hypothetical protein